MNALLTGEPTMFGAARTSPRFSDTVGTDDAGT